MIRADRAGYDQLSGCGLNLLTRDELDQIHYGTLEVLEQAGLIVFTDEAMEIYYSHGWNLGDILQSRSRLHRPGQTRSVTYVHLLAEGTVDVEAVHALARRENLIESVLRRVARKEG